jgi:folate-binding Fe-S cluster repair protein YgfZ
VWHYGDPLGEQRAAARGAVVVDRSHRAALTLTGKDRQTWLHSISTQHVSTLPDGAVTENISLDLQGRVEDHWIQTELGGTTYLDTESWRAEPLLSYLRKMVFWADVQIEPAELAVLSLLGPALADPAVLTALSLDALPAELSAVALADGGFVRRMPATTLELDLVVPREQVDAWKQRLGPSRTRSAGSGPRSTWTRAATGARRPSHACTTWESHRGCWCCCSSTDPPNAPRPVTP